MSSQVLLLALLAVAFAEETEVIPETIQTENVITENQVHFNSLWGGVGWGGWGGGVRGD